MAVGASVWERVRTAVDEEHAASEDVECSRSASFPTDDMLGFILAQAWPIGLVGGEDRVVAEDVTKAATSHRRACGFAPESVDRHDVQPVFVGVAARPGVEGHSC